EPDPCRAQVSLRDESSPADPQVLGRRRARPVARRAGGRGERSTARQRGGARGIADGGRARAVRAARGRPLRRPRRVPSRRPHGVGGVERRAGLAIALGERQRADSLLAEVLRRRPSAEPSVPVYLARAEANFTAGRDSAGYAWYDSALAYADVDSTGAMWDAV